MLRQRIAHSAVPMALAVLLAGIVSICLPAHGTVDDVPRNLYGALGMYDYNNTRTATVLVVDWQAPTISLLFKGYKEEAYLPLLLAVTPLLLDYRFGVGAHLLYVLVLPAPGMEGEAYWWPENLVFVQGGSAFHIMADDIFGPVLHPDALSGRVYTTMDGIIHVPDLIRYSRPFDIWYGDEKTTLGPISSEPATISAPSAAPETSVTPRLSSEPAVMHFEGSASVLTDSFTLPAGQYRVHLKTAGFAIVNVIASGVPTKVGAYLFNVVMGQAIDGVSRLYNSDGERIMLEIRNITAPYELWFEKVN